MLFLTSRLALLAQCICLLCDVQLGSLPAARLVRKSLASLEFFLQTVLIKSFQLLHALSYAVRLLLRQRFWFDFLRHLLLLRSTAWVRQVVEILGWVCVLEALQRKLPANYLLEILLVAIILRFPFFYME